MIIGPVGQTTPDTDHRLACQTTLTIIVVVKNNKRKRHIKETNKNESISKNELTYDKRRGILPRWLSPRGKYGVGGKECGFRRNCDYRFRNRLRVGTALV